MNALENGDYTFHFAETKLSRREKELNIMMNRIKEILANARNVVIENEKFLSLIVEGVSTGILILNDQGIVQTTNQSALNMLGLPVFTHIKQLWHVNETFPELFSGLKAGDTAQISIANEREVQEISLHVSELRLKRGIMRVITMSNIGNELEGKEMESWIRLIRVMTHEIMNSIAPISSLSQTMLSLFRSSNFEIEDKSMARNVIDAFETINVTTAGLLSFVESYRKFTSVPTPKKQPFDLANLCMKVIKLHENTMKENHIEVVTHIDPDISLCADENLITQVLVNLVKNAVEAVDVAENRKIVISANLSSNEKIIVSVANAGSLIPDDVLQHIFIPFFTTKASGSGIGLSVSRYIMRLHGGTLHHSLSPEGMTQFNLVFPA
ncbi:MAG: GHKL domain-containing protein [Tannerella sp.]|nr:GHKL domain-containing protein [Tannerella sp.]